MDSILRIRTPFTPATESPAAAAPSRSGNPRAFKDLFEGFSGEMDRGQHLMQRVVHGAQGLAPEQLLALQAGVYRYTEVVDLTTKLVDRACSGLKTTLQSQ